MNESLPPEGRRVSYKSLDSEAMAAARRAAEAAGISLQEWLSRTILENARKSGVVPDNPSREVAAAPSGQPNAEEAVQAIARHLERAKAAADQQGLSLAEWLSRAILTNASTGDSALARRSAPPSAPPVESAPAPAPRAEQAAPKPASDTPSGSPTPPRFRARPAPAQPAPAAPAPEEAPLPEASSVRDVLSRAGNSKTPAATAVAAVAAATKRRRSTRPLWAALAVLVLVAAGIWALPHLQAWREQMRQTAEPATPAEPSKGETASALPEARPEPTRPDPTAPPPKPPEAVKPPEAPAARPPARPTEKAETLPAPSTKPPETAKPVEPKIAEGRPGETKPAEKSPLPDTGAPESDLARVPAKDMPKPASAHLDWYKKAAEADNYDAQYALAELYLKGDGVPKSYPAAAQMFRRAADKGNLARAQYALGLLYQRGLGVQKSDVEAVLWWQKAAAQNFMPAITWVGLSLLEGKGIQKDEEAARKMLERAAEGDEPNAQYTLCRIYEKGIGTNKDQVLAMKWCILAAEQAHPAATQKVEEYSTSMPRDMQERATEEVSRHYQRFRKRS